MTPGTARSQHARRTRYSWRLLSVLVMCTLAAFAVPLATPRPAHAASGNTVEDDFTRANQSHWGTSHNTDGDGTFAWTSDASSDSHASIASNSGQWTYNSTSSVQAGFAGSSTYTSGDSLTEFQFSAVGHATASLVLQAASDKSSWYQCQADTTGNQIRLEKKVSGTITDLHDAAFTFAASTKYWLRCHWNHELKVLKAKVWANGTTEPGTWTVQDDELTALAANEVGIVNKWPNTGTGETVKYFAYAFQSGDGATALAPDTSGSTKPVLTSITPDYQVQGKTISLVGSNFTGTTAVKLGATSASFSVVDSSHITITIPAGLSAGTNMSVSVTNASGTTVGLTYYAVNDGSANCTPNCAVNFAWSSDQTVYGDCLDSTGHPAGLPTDQGTGFTQCYRNGSPLATPAAVTNDTTCIEAANIVSGKSTCTGMDGTVIEVRWSDLESTQGVYDFTSLDNQINDWVAYTGNPNTTFTVPNTANGVPFQVGINVEYLPDGGGSGTGCGADSTEMPSYVTSDASINFFCDTSQAPSFGPYNYPDYCAANFVSDLDAFMAALATHIAHEGYSPDVRYVSPGVGIGHEASEFRGNSGDATEGFEEAAFENFEDLSDHCINDHSTTTTTFSSWQRSRLQNWAGDFAYTKVSMSLNSQHYGTDPTALQELDQEWYALASNFAGAGNTINHGIESQDLTNSASWDSQLIGHIDAVLTNINGSPAYPSSAAHGAYFHSYETDTGATSATLVDGYLQTAYCYAGGFENAGNTQGLIVAWRTKVLDGVIAGGGTETQKLYTYVNGTVTPGTSDDNYCLGYLGYTSDGMGA